MVSVLRVPLMLVVGALVAGVACERPPVGGGGEVDVGDGRAVVDLPSFLQDRPAIGGKWYTYNVDGHIMEPKDEAWVLRTEDGRAFAFRIVSVYDDASGDSGVFHLDVAAREGDGWREPARFVAAGNVKDGPGCVDVIAAAAGAPADRSCADDEPWHLRLQQQQRLSVFAGFAVAEPAVFVHDTVRVARFDGVDLSDLPAPDTIAVLDDDARFDASDWSFSELAPDLPAAGQVLGVSTRVIGQTWWLWSSTLRLVRFTVTSGDEALTFTVDVRAIDNADQSVAETPDAESDLSVPLTTLPVYLAVADVGFTIVDAATVLADAPHPGATRRWDLAVVDDGGPRLLLSPAAAAIAGSAVGLDPPFLP
jgi:hypothetical protein